MKPIWFPIHVEPTCELCGRGNCNCDRDEENPTARLAEAWAEAFADIERDLANAA